MNDKKHYYRNLRVPLVILVVLFFFAAIMPFYSRSEIKTNELCVDLEVDSWLQQPSQEDNTTDQFNCLPDANKQLLNLFILGLINIDDLTMWVLGVDRRLLVLKMMHEKKLLQASDIADSTERSLQNISYAMRELEEQGLIKCLTPGKHTWKKFIPTEKGIKVFEKLKKNHLID